jgi:REP element-mobilizing transposase RayT
VERKRKGKPPRLDRVFQKYDPSLYFVTFNTHLRRQLLASPPVHSAFVDYCQRGYERHIGVGRYVMMPDHVHLFVRFGQGCELTLGTWIKGLKRGLDSALAETGAEPSAILSQELRTFWQPGFHDHLLRSDESYSEKWMYVRENPVRAGLVSNPNDWPYAGEIVVIDRV